MKYIASILTAFLLTFSIAQAAPTSWDFTAGVLQPLISAYNAMIKGSYFVATSTVATSTFPIASSTTICLGSDCRTAWPTGGAGLQTPWTSDINGANFSLSNILNLTANGTGTMANLVLAGQTVTSTMPSFLSSPTSANLLAAVPDETGTGALVFGTAPTITNLVAGNVRGGTTAAATLVLRSTSNAAPTTDAVIFQTGNSVERGRISTQGQWSIGTTTATTTAIFTIAASGTTPSLLVFGTTSLASTSVSSFTSTATTTTGGLSIASLSGFLKATAGAVGTSLVNLASDITGTLSVANGGTGSTTLSAGEILVGNGTSAITSTTTTNLKASMNLGNVENTALSTWGGSANLSTLGTVNTGTWNASTISIAKGGTGTTTAPDVDMFLIGNGTNFDYKRLVAGSNVTISTSTPGQIVISSTGGGAGSQTPWTSDINGGGFSLSNVLGVSATSATTSILTVTGTSTLATTTLSSTTIDTLIVNKASTLIGALTTIASTSLTGSTSISNLTLPSIASSTQIFGLFVDNNGTVTGTATSGALAASLTDETGTGQIVFSNSPVMANIASTIIRGGSTGTTVLTLKSTSGVGTGDAIVFQTGNSVERGRISSQGQWSFGTTSSSSLLNFYDNNTASATSSITSFAFNSVKSSSSATVTQWTPIRNSSSYVSGNPLSTYAGVSNFSQNISTNTVNSLYGSYNQAQHSTNIGTTTNMYGSYNLSTMAAQNSTITNMFGATGVSFINGAATGTNASFIYGLYGTVTNSGSATATNAYGIYSQGCTTNNALANIGTCYGLMIASSTALAGSITSRYGLYQGEAAAKNFFAGSVGIGTTSPTYALSVVGTSTFTAGMFGGGTATSAAVQTGYWCYDANGQFIRTSVACITSAEKYKTNIHPLNLTIDDLMNIRFVTYKKKNPLDVNDSHTQMGVIADEVDALSPALSEMLVTRSGDGQIQSFRYDQFTALLGKAIQDQQKEIIALGGGVKSSAQENWQWLAIGVLFLLVILQQYQISKLRP